ncbi:hypothetical protein H2199_004057 [Coniosporium tulheliwenetii]|uniref:Uncharacterized protein n=1 Tax=Coniosporium tulheliwenetii TaxID=3383036 RepID=A0ACC2Z779_9PEZI|nr:hypothetical protein H2199_004057 [Cladosporium sp. JES 115]
MTDYAKMKNDELQALLKQRGLPHTGKKADMVTRLQEADKKAPDTQETKSTTAPSSTTLAAGDDEIDWDDDAADATKPDKPADEAAPAAEEEKKAEAAAPAADAEAEKTDAKADTAAETTDAANDTTEAPKSESEKPAEKEKTPVDFSSGLAATTLEEELEKRRARAKKFGITETDEEATKKLERAKKFGETAGPPGLNEALPERTSKKRGREGGEKTGLEIKREERRNGSKRRSPDRTQKTDKTEKTNKTEKSGGAPTWMSDADKAKAEARKAKFGAAS